MYPLFIFLRYVYKLDFQKSNEDILQFFFAHKIIVEYFITWQKYLMVCYQFDFFKIGNEFSI
jgi:hypothetical protein